MITDDFKSIGTHLYNDSLPSYRRVPTKISFCDFLVLNL